MNDQAATKASVRRQARRYISLFAVVGLLSGCAQGGLSTQASRLGADDGADSCRPALVALDSTGNFFGAQILTGAAVGAVTGGLAGGLIGRDWRGALIGAAVGGAVGATGGYLMALQQQSLDQAGMFSQVRGDLERENAQIDRTQLAFDQLSDCRYRQAMTIRADYRAGRIDRATASAAMALVKQRAQRDLALAQQINQQIAGRAEQFEIAADRVAPGTKQAVATPPPPRPARLRQPTTLKLRPDATAPDIGTLQANDSVTVTGTRAGYAAVQTSNGQRGYAPVAAFQGRLPTEAGATAASGGSGELRTLAGSNAARRDDFAQSVAVSQQAAATGFELAA